MSIAVTKITSVLKQGAGILCLFALLASQPQLFTGVLALAALTEGSHTVHVGQNGAGECKLVLSHERGQPGQKNYNPGHSPHQSTHHHGLASRLVCTLAGGTHQLSDHVAHFSLGSASEKSFRAKLQQRAALLDVSFGLAHPSVTCSLPLRSTALPIQFSGAPPAALQVATSTVLLI